MKPSLMIIALSMAALMLVQFGCAAPPTNRAESVAMSSPTPEVVDNAAIEREILRIENDYPRALKEKDAESARRVLADDAILIWPDGKLGDKATEVKDIGTGAMTFDTWDLADLKVQVLDADTALATGRAIVTNGKIKLPDGKTVNTSGQYRFVDTFHRREGQWKLVAGAAVKILEPMPAPSPSPMATTSPAARTSPSPAASPAASRTP